MWGRFTQITNYKRESIDYSPYKTNRPSFNSASFCHSTSIWLTPDFIISLFRHNMLSHAICIFLFADNRETCQDACAHGPVPTAQHGSRGWRLDGGGLLRCVQALFQTLINWHLDPAWTKKGLRKTKGAEHQVTLLLSDTGVRKSKEFRGFV